MNKENYKNANQRKLGVVILILDKVDLRTSNLPGIEKQTS